MSRWSNTVQDRIFACLTYLLPLLEVLGFGFFLFALIPPLATLFSPLFILLPFYNISIGGIGIVQWGIFLGLYFGVVQNRSFSYLLRFNAMQALLLGIFAALCGALLQLFGYSQNLLFSELSIGNVLIIGIVCSAIFIFVVGASIYSIIQAARNESARIPIISDAASSHVY